MLTQMIFKTNDFMNVSVYLHADVLKRNAS